MNLYKFKSKNNLCWEIKKLNDDSYITIKTVYNRENIFLFLIDACQFSNKKIYYENGSLITGQENNVDYAFHKDNKAWAMCLGICDNKLYLVQKELIKKITTNNE